MVSYGLVLVKWVLVLDRQFTVLVLVRQVLVLDMRDSSEVRSGRILV